MRARERWGRPEEVGGWSGKWTLCKPHPRVVSYQGWFFFFAQTQGKFDSMLKYVIWQENFFPSLLANIVGTGGSQEV